MRVPLIGGAHQPRSLAAGAQSMINVFPELSEDPNERAKGIGALYGVPGRHLFKNLTSINGALTPVRGLWTGGGRLFVAAGARYCEVDSAGSLVGSVRTIVNAADAPVQFFGNGNQLLIISDNTVYIDNGAGPVAIDIGVSTGTVDTNGTLVTWISGDKFPTGTAWTGKTITINAVAYTIDNVSAPDQLYLTGSAGVQSGVAYSQAGEALTGVTGAYLDGYFLVNRPAGGTPDLGRQINFSAILDGTDWNGVDMFIKEGYPDYIRSILANNEQLYVFGHETIQVFQNTGDATTPFQPIPGSMSRVGSCSSWGPAAIDGHVYFIGGTIGGLVAYVMDGFTPRRISTHTQEVTWKDADAPGIITYAYQEQGHTFWVINYTSLSLGSAAWAYDTVTGLWHQRYDWDAGTSDYVRYQTWYHAHVEWAGGVRQHITGWGSSGKLYESNIDFYDNEGADTRWERSVPYIANKSKRVFFGRTMLECETGTVPSGAAPDVNLEYSDDRGHTWSTPIPASLGVHDDFSREVYWHPTGSSYGRVLRFSGEGQSKVALVDLNIEVTEGDV